MRDAETIPLKNLIRHRLERPLLAQPFRTAYGSFGMDSGPFRATLVDPDFFQLRRATVASRQTVADKVSGIGIRLGGCHSIALPTETRNPWSKHPSSRMEFRRRLRLPQRANDQRSRKAVAYLRIPSNERWAGQGQRQCPARWSNQKPIRLKLTPEGLVNDLRRGPISCMADFRQAIWLPNRRRRDNAIHIAPRDFQC